MEREDDFGSGPRAERLRAEQAKKEAEEASKRELRRTKDVQPSGGDVTKPPTRRSGRKRGRPIQDASIHFMLTKQHGWVVRSKSIDLKPGTWVDVKKKNGKTKRVRITARGVIWGTFLFEDAKS